MKTEHVRWTNWDAVRCVARECEIVVGVSAGPRILSLRRGTGSNLLYHDTTCADYVELETLSGIVTLAPGEHATHLQRWRLLAPTFTPQDWPAIGTQAGCTSTERRVQYAP